MCTARHLTNFFMSLCIVDRITLTGDPTIKKFDTNQFLSQAGFFRLNNGCFAYEITFVEFYNPSAAGLNGVGVVAEFVTVKGVFHF